MQTNDKKAVWIDGKKAIIISLSGDAATATEIRSGIESSQHPGPGIRTRSMAGTANGANGAMSGFRRLDTRARIARRRLNQRSAYLEKVAEAVRSADPLYLMGPGPMKVHLWRRMLEEHESRHISIENASRMTRPQLISRVRRFWSTKPEK